MCWALNGIQEVDSNDEPQFLVIHSIWLYHGAYLWRLLRGYYITWKTVTSDHNKVSKFLRSQ